jgi:hypothetical protein
MTVTGLFHVVWPIIVESYVDEIGESMTGTTEENNNLNLGKCSTGYLAVTRPPATLTNNVLFQGVP